MSTFRLYRTSAPTPRHRSTVSFTLVEVRPASGVTAAITPLGLRRVDRLAAELIEVQAQTATAVIGPWRASSSGRHQRAVTQLQRAV